MTTNEQAVETCRRSKSVCAKAIADARRTILHYCSRENGELIQQINELEIAVNTHLDHEARAVFAANMKDYPCGTVHPDRPCPNDAH